MTKEDKELLLKDLCARLPYGCMLRVEGDWFDDEEREPYDCKLTPYSFMDLVVNHDCDVKPYLRPMSSMTDEEYEHYNDLPFITAEDVANAVFWYYEHHFDVYGLIEKGLAIEAPEGMYKKRLDMEHEIELQIMPSGNVAVYRGNGFIPTEQLTEEEKEFIIDRIADELGVNTKGDRETFAEHYGCIPEYEELESPETTEND